MATIRDIPRRFFLFFKKLKPSRAKSLLNTGAVLLLLGLIAFSVYQVARHLTVGLNTLRTQEIVDKSYVQLELYLFRNEQVLYAEGAEACLYRVKNGEKVGVGASIGTAYAVGGGTDAASLQAKLDAYGDRIALVEQLGGLGTPTDARDEAEAIDRDYLGLLEAAGQGDLSAVGGFAEEMLSGIGRYDILTGAAGSTGTVSSLVAEQEALVAGLTTVANITADRGGYFYYEADGYESVFPYQSAMTMTPAEFRAMTEQEAYSVPTGVVGKMVYDQQWYAAAYVSLSDAALEVFQQGINSSTSYTMRCGDSAGTELTMTIVRMVPDENGALLVFRTQSMPDGFAFERSFRVETVSHSVSGYRIPTEAVVTLHSSITGEDVTGVYILAGGVVEFRKIHIQVRRDGYIIVATYEDMQSMLDACTEEERAAMTADGWSYLRLNDNIITSGNELYEGKMIS